MRLVSLTAASSLTHDRHGTVRADPDGLFTVPEDLGADLVRFPALWEEEQAHADRLSREETARLADPREAGKVLGELRGRVSELEAEVTRLRKPARRSAS